MRGVVRSCLATLAVALVLAPEAGAAISHVRSSSGASTSSTLSISRPTNTTTNDVMVATVAGEGTATFNAPAGWTLIGDTTATNNGTRMFTYFKVAASEPGSYAFTSSSARDATGGIMTLRGVNRTVPIDAVADATGASGVAIAPSVTTTAAGDWVITAATAARNTSFSATSGSSERYDRAGASTSTAAHTFTQFVAGATAAKTMTPGNQTAPWMAHTIALRDAATAGLSLSVGADTAEFSASLDSGDTTHSWSVPVNVDDTRISPAGWQTQVTSTTFTAIPRTLPTTATELTGVSAVACDNNAPCELPVNSVAFPVEVPAGTIAPTAVKVYNAAAGSGEGRVNFTADFSTLVPQNAFAGNYTATVTISVVSGP